MADKPPVPTQDGLPLTEERSTTHRSTVAPTDAAKENAYIQDQLARAGQEREQLAQLEKSNIEAEEREQAPVEKAIQSLMGEKAAAVAPTPTADKIKFTPSSDAYTTEGVQALSFALIAAAVIGGIKSKGNWEGATAPLIGALQGWHDGDAERHDREMKEFDRRFQVAMAHDQAAFKEYEDLQNRRDMSINMWIRRSQEIASRHGHDAIRENALQRSIDGIMQTVGAHQMLLDRLNTQKTDFMEQYGAASRSALGQLQTGPAWDLLDDYGKWLVGGSAATGWIYFSSLVSGRWGANNVPMVNAMGKQMREAGVNPGDITANHFGQAVATSTRRFAQMRLAAVERLSNTVKALEPTVAQIANKVNGFGPRWENATMNALTTWMTANGRNTDVAMLKGIVNSVSLMAQEIRTMPASNAQMHATTQVHAAELLGYNMSIADVKGALQAIDQLITAETGALRDMNTQLAADQAGIGGGIWPTPAMPGAPPAPAPAAPVVQPVVPPTGAASSSSHSSAAAGHEGEAEAAEFLH